MDDLARIGAGSTENGLEWVTCVIPGSGSGLPPLFDVTLELPQNGGVGSRGLVFEGFRDFQDDWMGEWLAGIGDIDGDGVDDIAISGLTFNSENFPGEAFIIYRSDQVRSALNGLFNLADDPGIVSVQFLGPPGPSGLQ